MNRDKVIEKILTNMPENIRKNDNLLLKARYAYLELCKNVKYDADYNLGTAEEKSNIYYNGSSETDVGLCNEIAFTGVELFEKLGIDAVVMDIDGNTIYRKMPNDQIHMFFVFTLNERDFSGNKRFYLADPTYDIKRAKIGCMTKYFASNPVTEKNPIGYPKSLVRISSGDLMAIDREIGYLNGCYTDTYLKDLKMTVAQKIESQEMMSFETLDETVKYVLHELKENVFAGRKELGISDMQSSYKMIFHQIFEKIAVSNIKFDMKKHENGEYECTIRVFKDGKSSCYCFNKEKNEYVEEVQKDVRDCIEF